MCTRAARPAGSVATLSCTRSDRSCLSSSRGLRSRGIETGVHSPDRVALEHRQGHLRWARRSKLLCGELPTTWHRYRYRYRYRIVTGTDGSCSEMLRSCSELMGSRSELMGCRQARGLLKPRARDGRVQNIKSSMSARSTWRSPSADDPATSEAGRLAADPAT